MAVSTPIIKTLPAVVVTTAGTAVPVIASFYQVYSISIESLSSNTGSQYLGDSSVTSSNGIKMEPGEVIEIEVPTRSKTDVFDASQIYLNSSTNNANFRLIVWVRE